MIFKLSQFIVVKTEFRMLIYCIVSAFCGICYFVRLGQQKALFFIYALASLYVPTVVECFSISLCV